MTREDHRPKGRGRWSTSPVVPLVLLGAFAFLLYLNSAGNGFVFDDLKQLVQNPSLSSQRWMNFFRQDVWAFLGSGEPQSNAYRPLQMLCYAALVRSVGHQPFYFHLFNILLHALNTMLVYGLVRGLAPMRPFDPIHQVAEKSSNGCSDRGEGQGSSYGLAFIAAALFASHPIHAQTVNFIGALGDLLCTFFVLIALLLAAQAKRSRDDGSRVSGYASARYWLGPLAFVGALLSKELALILPALLVALWIVCFHEKRASRLARRLAPYVVVMAGYLALRLAVLGFFHKLNNQFPATFYEITLLRVRLAGAYLAKLVWPGGLSMYYAFRPTRTLLLPEVWMSLIVFVGVTACLWRWRHSRHGGPLIWLGWVWILVTLIPMMNLRALGTHVFADWYLYLTSVGFVMMVSEALDNFRLRFKPMLLVWRNGLVGVTVLILLVSYSVATVRQNTYWRDGYALFSHGVKVSPNSALHRTNYAHQLVLRNRLDEAMEQDQEAIRVASGDFGLAPEAIFAPEADLGWMYMLRGESQSAEQHLRNATALQPKNPIGHIRLGYVLEKEGRLAEALEAFGRATTLDPRNPFPHLARGNVYVKLKQDQHAIPEFQQAITLGGGTRAAYERLIQALERQGRREEAREWREKLSRLQGQPGS